MAEREAQYQMKKRITMVQTNRWLMQLQCWKSSQLMRTSGQNYPYFIAMLCDKIQSKHVEYPWY